MEDMKVEIGSLGGAGGGGPGGGGGGGGGGGVGGGRGVKGGMICEQVETVKRNGQGVGPYVMFRDVASSMSRG